MKKRLIAVCCALAVVLGVGAVLATNANAAANAFRVGYAKVDINPYVNGKDSSLGFIQLPVAGSTAMSRFNETTGALIDDNGDGEINEKDGLFATCIAITGNGNDETVLLFSMDVINANEKFVNEVRPLIVAELKEKAGVTIPAENIQIQGTHTHNSVDVDQFYTNFAKDRSKTYNITDAAGKATGETITAGELYDNLMVWKTQLISKMKAAAVEAVQDRKEAALSKGSVQANAVADKTMNSVRHYLRQNTDGEAYAMGNHFNTDNSLGARNRGTNYYDVAYSKMQMYAADDTLYCLQFDFGTAAEPIVIVNWRAHPNSNGTTSCGLRLNISSDYVNAMNKVLEDENYRPFFMQGAGGSVGIASELDNWLTKDYPKNEGNADADSDGQVSDEVGDNLKTNRYGKKLGQVALACLDDSNMKPVSNGDGYVNVQAYTYYTSAKTYGGDVFYKDAGNAAKAYFSNYNETNKSGTKFTAPAFKYPDDIFTRVIDNSGTTMATMDKKGLTKAQISAIDAAEDYQKEGKSYIISSTFHAGDLLENWNETGEQEIKVTAFALGDGVAFVTAPGELYDRYSDTLSWEKDIKGKSQEEAYKAVRKSDNDWKDLVSDIYGTPFVMGYANAHIGYVPNKLAYEYNLGSDPANLAVGAYEANITECAQGTGEELLTVYADLLDTLANKVKVKAQVGDKKYAYVEDAVAACQPGEELKLLGNIPDRVQITKDMTVDLNGYNFNPTVSAGVSVTCADSQTDDYDVKDGKGYGKVAAAVADKMVAAEGYLKITHGDGMVSFHKVDTKVDSVSLSPAKAGMYYSSLFMADQVVKENIESFGVALSRVGDPKGRNNQPAAHCGKTAFTQKQFVAGNREEFASTTLTNILKTTNDDAKNKTNAHTIIYGRAYIELTGGTFLWSEQAQRTENGVKKDGITLKWVIEYINNYWDTLDLNATQKQGVLELYGTYGALMEKWGWKVANIKTAS